MVKSASKAAEGFRIVGVGSSAGGLEAVAALLRVLPEDAPLAVVCVSHLDPRHESNLVEILRRATRLAVSSVADGVTVEQGNVYVMPPNAEVTIARGKLHLAPRAKAGPISAPIDIFFSSLAHAVGPRAVGVVLSGSASDGTIGLKLIKEAGGATYAQDEASAKFSDMPRNAVRSGAVDHVLPPSLIGDALVHLAYEPIVARPEPATVSRISPVESAAQAETAFLSILSLLHERSGVDFSHYKRPTLTRRVQLRMGLVRLETVTAYAELVAASPTELADLFEDVLIDVTAFFRKPDVLSALRTIILPRLLKGRADGETIRVWVPGCSSGEEAYSIAIALAETIDSNRGLPRIQVIGTDVSEASVERARRGVYSADIEADVSPERLARFFDKTERGYQVKRSLRDLCIFAKHNIVSDPPFSKLDIISCRNVMIYLGPALQDRVVPTFHYSLRDSGFLLLGEAETVNNFPDLFEVLDKKLKVFAKRNGASAISARVVQRRRASAPTSLNPFTTQPAARAAAGDPLREADRLVLTRYTPPGAILSEDFEVLQFRGHTGLFLEPPPGQPNLSILRMAREGLVGELRAALLAAKRDGIPVTTPLIKLKTPAGVLAVTVEVVPFKTPGMPARHYIVLFNNDGPPRPAGPDVTKPPNTRVRKLESQRQADIAREELASVKDYLEGVLQERDDAIEELKAGSEELQSANEELQSTNEELETAKEELQSGNEELTTLNEELNERAVQLAVLSEDLNSILSSTETAILVIDKHERIRRLTTAASRVLGIHPRDVGGPFSLVASRLFLTIPGIMTSDAPIGTRQVAEAQASDGRWYQLTARPVHTSDGRFDGQVITVIDIDDRKRAAQEAADARDYAESVISEMAVPLVVLDDNLVVISTNPACERALDATAGQLVGRPFAAIGGASWESSLARRQFQALAKAGVGVENFEAVFTTSRDEKHEFIVTACRVKPGARGARFLVILEDVTDRRLKLALERSKLLSREMARRLLMAQMGPSGSSPEALRSLGKSLLPKISLAPTAESYVDAFTLMGLGSLRFVRAEGDRWEFAGTDLLERRDGSATPTCYLTLGYLEAVVARLAGATALGSEMKCQSTSHDECVFALKAQTLSVKGEG